MDGEDRAYTQPITAPVGKEEAPVSQTSSQQRDDEKSEDVDEVEEYESEPRYSYEHARSQDPGTPPRIPLSRHSSAVTTISRLRARNVAEKTFTHPLGHAKTNSDVLVRFDGPDDLYRPTNWPFKKKVLTTFLYAQATMTASFASAVYSPAIGPIANEFHVSQTVSGLGIALLLFGFGLGPLLWAPLSEVFGRKIAVLGPLFIAGIFCFATATAKDIQTVLITRFWTGFMGSAPITNTGGVMGDLWSPQSRGNAIVGYAIAVIGGPTLAPLVGGAIVTSSLGWRWTSYVTGIYMMCICALDVTFIDESFGPTLLVYKARRLRHETGNWALHAEHEEWDVSVRDLSRKYLVRPFQMLVTPICLLIAIYASFVYAILYANLAAFPIAFEQLRGWNKVLGGLPFLAVLVGILFGAIVNILNNRYYNKRFVRNKYRAVPEARLPPMMVGAFFFSAGLFVFSWTARKSVFWFWPILGAAFIGLGFTTIFQAALNYLVDTFQKYGASAVAANTFLRSMLAGTFPIFIPYMYGALGVDWAGSVFGFISVAMIPIPILFFVYGKRLRARGVWSRESL